MNGRAGMLAWRGEGSQSPVFSWRLVDSGAEHGALAAMLEASKPALPAGSQVFHNRLFAPLQYASQYPSPFRRPNEAGAPGLVP